MKTKTLAITLMCFGVVSVTEDASAYRNRVYSHKQSDKVRDQQARQAAKYQAKLAEKNRKTEVRRKNAQKKLEKTQPYEPLPYGVRSNSKHIPIRPSGNISMEGIIEIFADMISGFILKCIEAESKNFEPEKPKTKVRAIQQELPQTNAFPSRPRDMDFDLTDLYGN